VDVDVPQKVALGTHEDARSSEKITKCQAPKSTKTDPLVGSKRLKGQSEITEEKEASLV
jgi:hypothetical protein